MRCKVDGKYYYFPLLHLRDEHGISEEDLLQHPEKWLEYMKEHSEP